MASPAPEGGSSADNGGVDSAPLPAGAIVPGTTGLFIASGIPLPPLPLPEPYPEGWFLPAPVPGMANPFAESFSAPPAASMSSPAQNNAVYTQLPPFASMASLHSSHFPDMFSQITPLSQLTEQGLQQASGQSASETAPVTSEGPLSSAAPSTNSSVVDGFPNHPLTDFGLAPTFGAGFTSINAAGAFHNLGPTNATLHQFLVAWGEHELGGRKGDKVAPVPKITGNTQMYHRHVHNVEYESLHGDDFDIQGINWASMGVTRREARVHREKTYKNYCMNESDAWETMPQNTETYFRFKKYKMRKTGYLAHFQLRNLLVAPSRSRVLFADNRGVVRQYNSVTCRTSIALRFPSSSRTLITTIAAGEGLLVAGGLEGEYCTAKIEPTFGRETFGKHASPGFTHLRSGISNHIQVHSRRNGGSPVAALASNDSHLRLLDLTTQKVVSDVAFKFPVNCTAVSPDRKMRVVVGDDKLAYIVTAEHERNPLLPDGAFAQPDTLQTLGGHKDFGFACAWADDGYTLATGYQDRAIKIWDARKTSNASGIWAPIATLRTAMAGVRNLQFSPAGSGKRVLVAAEEADIINIIDAQTFQKRQAFDLFGELAGVSFTDNGQDLFALCADPGRGGLLHLQRNGIISNAATFDETPHPSRPGFSKYDWPEPGDPNDRQRSRYMRKRLRSAATASLDPY
ncbi:hypothetical protein SCUCBS95973_005106 [Sporothrix curviconia]|uniref:WD repeat protein n=1 Tax=Sporothrix curviconia TaxID=1260050 RepID=A0ABP0BU85_9PEZI